MIYARVRYSRIRCGGDTEVNASLAGEKLCRVFLDRMDSGEAEERHEGLAGRCCRGEALFRSWREGGGDVSSSKNGGAMG